MLYEVVMPQLGLSMTEGTVLSWLKEVGDLVEKGEPLLTVETDKVEMDVESVASGYLSAILINSGEAVPVGTVIATLTDQPQGTGA
jgi:2-oxoglutarate dehydrogenase E2 component (dihydrolipoamide succinyltransferase)